MSPGDLVADARPALDVPGLLDEIERLQGFLNAIVRHGSTVWSDTSCGRGGVGGQTITSTSHPMAVEHLALYAVSGKTLVEAADDYAAIWPPGTTSRLDEPPRSARRAGVDGRPV